MRRIFSLRAVAFACGLSMCVGALALTQLSYAQDTSGQNATNPAMPASEHRAHQHYQYVPLEQRFDTLKAALAIQPNQDC